MNVTNTGASILNIAQLSLVPGRIPGTRCEERERQTSNVRYITLAETSVILICIRYHVAVDIDFPK